MAMRVSDIPTGGAALLPVIGRSNQWVVEEFAIDDLTPNPAPQRKHSERKLTRLTGSIQAFGQLPILVTDGLVVLDGNAVLEACRRLGRTTISVIRVSHLRRATEIELMLALLPERSSPFVIPWPSPAGPQTFLRFDRFDDWHAFVRRLGLDDRIPHPVGAKFARAQRLYLLGWLDGDLVKAGELAALIALEMAVRDRYAHKLSSRRRSFAALLRYMVEADGLTDSEIPMIVQYGGAAVDRIIGSAKPSLFDLRNGMAHGDPFDALPVGGLLELVRDLVTFAYRQYLAEIPRLSKEGI